MKTKEYVAFYRERFGKEINGSGRSREFFIKQEGEQGHFKIWASLLKTPPIQSIESIVFYAPSWYVEVVREIREDDKLNHLMRAIHTERPQGGEILEEHLELALAQAYKLYEKIKQPEAISKYLTPIYEYGLTNTTPIYNVQFFYCCVFKGNVELLEAQRLAQENGTTILPPAYTLRFFTNAVRLAKQFRSGERVCPIDF